MVASSDRSFVTLWMEYLSITGYSLISNLFLGMLPLTEMYLQRMIGKEGVKDPVHVREDHTLE